MSDSDNPKFVKAVFHLQRRTTGLAVLFALVSAIFFSPDAKADIKSKGSTYWREMRVKVLRDLPYAAPAKDDGHLLDLYLPSNFSRPLPLIICIHGGGWGNGSKWMFPAFLLPTKGYAVASINYRLSTNARFPAQIDDCRAAMDWLIKHSKLYGLDETKIGVWGGSAGGHLASLLGLGYRDFKKSSASTRVKAVCDWCGPTDLATICAQYPVTQTGDEMNMSGMITRLLGSAPEKNLRLAKEASPSTYVGSKEPPFLIMHGDKDHVVPLAQSTNFSQRLIARGADCTLYVIPGEGHDFYSLENEMRVINFFDKTLRHGHARQSKVQASPKAPIYTGRR